ncbi:MAG: FAD-binding protein [Coriobacteriales bacterium]|jgi:succinate dehydrogenase/fumarate reductase flavoprotein subunit
MKTREEQTTISRRSLVRGIGAAGAVMGAMAAGVAVGSGASAQAKESSSDGAASAASSAVDAGRAATADPDDPTADPNGYVPDCTTDVTYIPQCGEYPTPKEEAPDQTEYICDVLVVGGGLAGLNAAFAAAQDGKSVILLDKSTPGYSGLSAWPSCTAYYDPDRDADRETWDKSMRLSCFNFANLNWEDVWCDESLATYNRLKEWGWVEDHPRGVDTEYYVDGNMFHDDLRGYFTAYADHDRHKVFMKVLNDNGVTVLDHTMLIDIVQDADGACVGGVALAYRSSTVLSITAKAVVLCTGNGVIKPMGYPVGADTFDGIWIGYQHGLPITGVEFEDFHMTTSYAPSNALMHNSWQYVEQIWRTGGTVTPEKLIKRAGVQERTSSYVDGFDYSKNDNTLMDGKEEGTSCSAAYAAGDTSDPRSGKWTSPNPKGHVYGAAVGMNVHTASGIWCGIDDTVGQTSIPGLYVAGDGTNGCYVGGPNYGCQRGSTSNFVSLQGYRAGQAASSYADGVAEAQMPSDVVSQISEYTLAPLSVTKGYSPSWAREALHAIMAPGWMTIAKNGDVLNAGLAQVLALKDLVHGKLVAQNGHDLRLAHEVEHQILAMELKLRAGLERKESRGFHYRTDYPFCDDNYLFYITQTKPEQEGADPVIGHVALPDRWVGDLSEPHEVRYPLFDTPEEYATYAPKEDGESSSASDTSNAVDAASSK